MNDEQYRQTREAISQPQCVYEKALQYGYFNCQFSRVMQLGEREGVHCDNPLEYKRCQTFHRLCLLNSGFALGSVHLPQHLPFNKAMQVQIGGLQGASFLLAEDKTKFCHQDIAKLLTELEKPASGFSEIDFSSIIQKIAQFSLRNKKR